MHSTWWIFTLNLLVSIEVGGRVGKSGKSGISGKGEGHVVYPGLCNVCGSTHSCGCVDVVSGSFARAAFRVLIPCYGHRKKVS